MDSGLMSTEVKSYNALAQQDVQDPKTPFENRHYKLLKHLLSDTNCGYGIFCLLLEREYRVGMSDTCGPAGGNMREQLTAV